MTRKNVYKVIFMTTDELFFLFFTHALPLSPTPQRTYGVKRLFPNFFPVTAFYRVGGRENSKIFLKTLHWFMREPRNYSYFIFFIFYFISFAKIKQTERKNVGRDTTTAVANRPFAWWRHFTTMTRILQGFAFLCKLGLLLFQPHWDYQI